jgi:hypothetical protein
MIGFDDTIIINVAACRMGGAIKARVLSRLESDTHRSQSAKRTGFAKGSTHPTGSSGREA